MPDEVIYRLPAPIKSGSELPDELRDRGVTEEEWEFYLSKVADAFEEVHGSQVRIFWVCMLVVFVVTIPFVFYYLFKKHKELCRRVTDLNRILEPHGIYGEYPLGSKHGPGEFEFRAL